jgi:hypothetical protein
LCFPLLDGKGDLNEDGGGRLGADGAVNGLGLYAGAPSDTFNPLADVDDALDDVDAVNVDDDDDELDARARGWNQVPGRFNPFPLGTLNDVDPDVSIFPLDIVHGCCLPETDYRLKPMSVG